MSDTSKLSTCQMVCWGLASLTGLMVLLASTRSLGLVPGVMLGVAVAVVLGVVFRWLVCTDYPDGDRGIEGRDVVRALRNATGITGYKAPLDQASVMDVAMGSKSAASRAPSADAAVKSDTVLDGEQELAERKGEWRFDAQEADMNDPASASVDDMVGVRPTGLNAPRGGQADDLKQIKGVGPNLEQLCNDFGFYHFDQIAAWTKDEVDWVDENLVGFKGRVSRDDWVAQAKVLAAGGDTGTAGQVAGDDAH
ncbi:NADH:ubiquinone oxidoreductase [Roseovarius tibetensis]|uniref:NADH:ubiquinone oxidoreductase n=1 Tax=Roseovarius tibetensis TaxID=2685897 RepID=UPI003D7F4F0B